MWFDLLFAYDYCGYLVVVVTLCLFVLFTFNFYGFGWWFISVVLVGLWVTRYIMACPSLVLLAYLLVCVFCCLLLLGLVVFLVTLV